MADSPSSGNDEWAARPGRHQPHAQDAARRDAQAVVGGLAVDQEPHARRRQLVGHARAVAAALLADHEQQADARLAALPQPLGRGHLRRQDALGVARAAADEHAALDAARDRTAARSRSAWRSTTCGSVAERGEHVEAIAGDRLLASRGSRARRAAAPAAGRSRPRVRSWNRCRRARASARPRRPDRRLAGCATESIARARSARRSSRRGT